MSKYVVALFRLKPEDSIESYGEWARSYVRPIMLAMPSVKSFKDGKITGWMDGERADWAGCELIEVTDFDEFERDNALGDGAVLGAQWRERLASWSVAYIEDFAAGGGSA